MDLTNSQAADLIRQKSPAVVDVINNFLKKTFVTRGGRLGSGMGLLLEGLWGYYMTTAISGSNIEVAWIADDMYNDYAVVRSDLDWDPSSGKGELFRIEAKSMNLGADESKAHFAELTADIGLNDLLLVITWRWEPMGTRSFPKVVEVLLERARPIAQLRDELHLARGGSFVDPKYCPDGCVPELCQHAGEPLNGAGRRERLTGPAATRPANVAFAANFGGLFRMVGVRGSASKASLERHTSESAEAARYVAFIRRSQGRLQRKTLSGRLD